ncbi:ABC transporter ATP-binding protein [Poriferisphaera sp. WC338]|uniref:ABC transporter ATP-binding protein n=1 Tax=Poriferisphaera sp. WC338 TaxID=3425129 RepID=UPI003D819D80
MESSKDILKIDDLRISFHTDDGIVPAVRGVSLAVPEGKTVALLGESGCGKSVTARAIMNFIDYPGKLDRGAIRLKRQGAGGAYDDILKLQPNSKQMRCLRWAEVAMIFQDPRHSLTPAYTVGNQIVEAIVQHQKISKVEAKRIAISLLDEVGIPAPARRVDDYPHQMSGGMCQRVMIAMALACQPRLLIADEPTTALDVTIQAQILDLLRRVQKEHDMSMLLISHDMGVVAEMADEVVVMYLGKIVEHGNAIDIFDRPKHPYTQKLFASMPRPDLDRSIRLPSIPGTVPDHFHVPDGCPFRGRCEEEFEACNNEPDLLRVVDGHYCACWKHDASEGVII